MSKLTRWTVVWFLLLLALPLQAQQIAGVVIDAQTGDSIPMASVVYQEQHIAVVSDIGGHFRIDRHEGWKLRVTAVGYVSQTIAVTAQTDSQLTIMLQPDSHTLNAVTIRTRRTRYSRKNNPAVELMKKVIERKKKTSLENRDYYQYNKYQKITFALNDIRPSLFDDPKMKKRQWLMNQVEVCKYTNKLILPISVDETVTQQLYRKKPHTERTIIKGQNSTGINELFQTGDILTTTLQDVFTDVNIYDDQVRLLQYPFTSPIGKGAISFYRYYIIDTLQVDQQRCIHLHFMPNNQQDFGFRGDIYVLADSSYQVKRCELTIPKKSDVNFVDEITIQQEFTQLPDSSWVLSVDDMVAQLQVASFLQKLVVIRNTRMTDYAFDELPRQLFKGSKPVLREANAMMRDESFWNEYRQVQLTKSESSMDQFIANLSQIKGFKYIIFGLKALIENFVETGTPSKVDIGPVNTMLTSNFIDGLRTRVSAQTTAKLNPHWFLSGYYAHGWKSHKNYYKAELTYSFNAKEYLPREFPKRTLSFLSTYDVTSPSDKFMETDKDNMFTSFKWARVDGMMFYNRQQLTFEREEDFGFKTLLSLKTEQNEAAGALRFTPLSIYDNGLSWAEQPSIKFRTTELRAELEYCPGATYINTKQRRRKINLDAPVFRISHAIGLKNVLGGDYSYNYTEASIYKRFWMRSWGKLDCYVRGGIQWEKVPYPLLCMPAANLSYIINGHTFGLVNNMEFLNDRYLMADIGWDMNGKLFNRVPLLKKLKWREYFGVRMLWGELSDKNNPYAEHNAGNPIVMAFPEGSSVMDPKRPYWELVLGVHNIFKIVHVEYVRRMSYNNLPTAHRQGIRMMVRMTF